MPSGAGCLPRLKESGPSTRVRTCHSQLRHVLRLSVVRAILLVWPKLQLRLFFPCSSDTMNLHYFVLLPLVLAFDNNSIALLPWKSTSDICFLLEKFRCKKADLTVIVNCSSRWQIHYIIKVSSAWPHLGLGAREIHRRQSKRLIYLILLENSYNSCLLNHAHYFQINHKTSVIPPCHLQKPSVTSLLY